MICRWFRETYKNGEDTDIFLRQLLFDFFQTQKKLVKGCGLIATNDVLLYMDYGVQLYTWESYHDNVFSTFNDFFAMQDNNVIPIPNSFSLSAGYVSQCLAYNGYPNICYSISDTNQNEILNLIESSIYKNCHVILLQDDRIPFYEDNIDRFLQLEGTSIDYDVYQRNGFLMFQIFKDASSAEELIVPTNDTMTYHYVTVTGVFYDNYSEETYLRVQSWGTEYYLKYEDFVEYNVSFNSASGYIIVLD